MHKALLVTMTLFALGADVAVADAPEVNATAAQIRAEAARGNDDPLGWPFPLAAHWNTGVLAGGFDPDWQMQMIKQDHHLLPWFQFPIGQITPASLAYYDLAIKRAAELHLPISFVGTQYESIMADEPYFSLPPDQNPNLLKTDGTFAKVADPFGPVDTWKTIGKQWTDNPVLKRIQELYPDPPLVMIVSNNEFPKLSWSETGSSQRYSQLYGAGHDGNFKRKVIGDGFIARYRALQDGMRSGLVNPTWQKNVRFVGYEATGISAFGRWAGWLNYSDYSPERISAWPLAWDGGSACYYTLNSDPSTDFTLWGPQVEGMNLVFMNEQARRMNPNYWFEISTWDGHAPNLDNDKRKTYAKLGQTATPERYGGFVQFGLWLMRPRAVREFRGWTDTVADAGPYFEPVMAAVDRIYAVPTLAAFWRHGTLVANVAHTHPYQAAIPDEYKNIPRWFLLDTNLDPPRPWTLATVLPVFSLALVQGQVGDRQWLIYAHAPLGDRKAVQLTIPDYGAVTVDVSVEGSFYRVDEKTMAVTPVSTRQPKASGARTTGERTADAGGFRTTAAILGKRLPGAHGCACSFRARRSTGDDAHGLFAGSLLLVLYGLRRSRPEAAAEVKPSTGFQPRGSNPCRVVGPVRHGSERPRRGLFHVQ